MSIPTDLPEKRPFVGQDQMPEQPPKNRQKLDDSEHAEVKVQKGGATTQKIYGYCPICKAKNVTHWYLDCPQKDRGLGKFCRLCIGPCRENEQGEHKKNIFVTIKGCTICGGVGTHWAEECRFRNPPPVCDDDPDDLNLFCDLIM